MTADLSDWIETHAAATPDKLALQFGDVTISYRGLCQRVHGATGLLRQGLQVGPGERIAYLGFNSPEFLVLLFACARLGAMLVPLNWRLELPELVRVVNHAGACVLFADPAHQQLAADLVRQCPGCALAESEALEPGHSKVDPAADSNDRVSPRSITAPDPQAGPTTPVLLVYTSGTTGQPKGVVLTQRALLFNALNSIDMHELTSSAHVLTVLPMFHVGGLNIQTTPALYVGATVTLHQRFDPGATLAALRVERPSHLVLVPATISALIQHPDWHRTDVQCLKMLTTGSSIVPHLLIEAWHERSVPVIQVYGSTETGPVALYQRREAALTSIGSVGRGAAHTQLGIVSKGVDVASGQPGELLLRGPNLFREYWQDPEATAAVLVDGWFKTGDIGSRDRRGFVFIHDRKKDMVISGGENIYPAELEQVLSGVPGIKEAAVVGMPDAKWGEVPVAVVVAVAPGTLTVDGVCSAFEGVLARYKHPRAVVFTSVLPRNAMGKVLKEELRDALSTGTIEMVERS